MPIFQWNTLLLLLVLVGQLNCTPVDVPLQPADEGGDDLLKSVPATLLNQLQSSQEVQPVPEVAQPQPTFRFFITEVTDTSTTTVATLTSTLTTFSSCYQKNPNGITDCKSTALTGRRKRDSSLIEESPMAVMMRSNGEVVDLRNLIAASKASDEVPDGTTTDAGTSHRGVGHDELAVYEAVDISGLFPAPEDGLCGRKGGQPQKRFITIRRTSTTSVTFTTTSTRVPAETETILFTTVNADQCFPSQLVASVGLVPC